MRITLLLLAAAATGWGARMVTPGDVSSSTESLSSPARGVSAGNDGPRTDAPDDGSRFSAANASVCSTSEQLELGGCREINLRSHVSAVAFEIALPLSASQLQVLDLGHTLLHSQTLLKMASVFSTTVFSALTTVAVDNTKLESVSFGKFLNSLAFQPMFTSLDLKFSGVSTEMTVNLAKLMRHSRSLRHLYIDGNALGPRGVEILAEGLEGSNLEVLHASGILAGVAGAAAIGKALEKNTRLHTLDLALNELGDSGVQALMAGLRKNPSNAVSTIRLSYNEITARGVEHLVTHLTVQNCPLHTLHIDNNLLQAAGAVFISVALRFGGLTALNVEHNAIGGNGAITLFDAASRQDLRPLRPIHVLDVRYNFIDDASAIGLAAVLSNGSTLRAIDMSLNHIKHTGAQSLSDSFIYNDQLETIRLSYNSIGDRGAAALALWIRRRAGLKQLAQIELQDTDISDVGAIELMDSLAEAAGSGRQVTTKLDLRRNHFLSKALINGRLASFSPGGYAAKDDWQPLAPTKDAHGNIMKLDDPEDIERAAGSQAGSFWSAGSTAEWPDSDLETRIDAI